MGQAEALKLNECGVGGAKIKGGDGSDDGGGGTTTSSSGDGTLCTSLTISIGACASDVGTKVYCVIFFTLGFSGTGGVVLGCGCVSRRRRFFSRAFKILCESALLDSFVFSMLFIIRLMLFICLKGHRGIPWFRQRRLSIVVHTPSSRATSFMGRWKYLERSSKLMWAVLLTGGVADGEFCPVCLSSSLPGGGTA